MIGSTLSQFTVLEELGRGGMGVVYLAEDSRLGRRVALKVLADLEQSDNQASRRFMQEARAIAALSHPNICTLYEVGEVDDRSFLAMEYVEGETLSSRINRGPIGWEEAATIARQIALGLEAAHEKGITHRDIKPGNIIIQPDGTVKILDFGLAKISGSLSVTSTTGTVGTMLYMSPEQVRNDEVDFRTDLWALGVVLFEMLSGARPFDGPYEAAVVYSILNEEPDLGAMDDVDVPSGLQTHIGRLMQKEVEDRPVNASNVVALLDDILAGEPAKIPSSARSSPVGTEGRSRTLNRIAILGGILLIVAVMVSVTVWFATRSDAPTESVATEGVTSILILPFSDLSPDSDQAYLAEGIAEELGIMIARAPAVRVFGSSSAAYYERLQVSALEIGRGLGVDYVLSGSIRSETGRLHLNAALTGMGDGLQKWAVRFDREASALSQIEQEIAQGISDTLGLNYSFGSPGTIFEPDPEARTQYLLGLHFLNQQVPESLQRAIAYLDSATDLEPDYALAYAAKARAFVILFEFGYGSVEYVSRLVAAADRSMALNPNLAEAHIAAAGAAEVTLQLEEIPEDLRRAIEINPSSGIAHHWLSSYYLNSGQLDLALEEAREANLLDPMDKQILVGLLFIESWLGHGEQARMHYERVMEIDPGYVYARLTFPFLLAAEGRTEEALALADSTWQDLKQPVRAAYTAGLYHRAGTGDLISTIINDLDVASTNPSTLMVLYSHSDDLDRAYAYADSALVARDYPLSLYHYLFTSASFREDPRFDALQEDLGLR